MNHPTPLRHKLPALVAFTFLFLSGSVVAQPALRLIRPAQGDALPGGSVVTIEWEGVTSSDTVRLSYSPDGGISWIPIAERATGLRHEWKVPTTMSSECLLQVSHRDPGAMTPQRAKITRSPESMQSTAFSPNDSLVVVTGASKSTWVYDRYSAAEVRRHTDPDRGAHNADFDRTGRRVITAHYNGKVAIWSIDPAGAPLSFVMAGRKATHAEFSHDNRRVVVSTDESVRVYSVADIDSGSAAPLFEYTRPDVGFLRASFSRGDSLIAFSASDRTITVLDGTSYQELRMFPALTGAEQMEISPSGRYIASTGNVDTMVRIWDINTGALVRALYSNGFVANDIAWGRNDSVIATITASGIPTVWDPWTATPLWSVPMTNTLMVAFSHNGNHIVFGNDDNLYVFWIPRERSTVIDVLDGPFSIGAPAAIEGETGSRDNLALVIEASGTSLDVALPGVVSGPMTITIVDAVGGSAARHNVESPRARIDIAELRSGRYLCRVENAGRAFVESFVVVR